MKLISNRSHIVKSSWIGLQGSVKNFDQANHDNIFWPRPNILKGSVPSGIPKWEWAKIFWRQYIPRFIVFLLKLETNPIMLYKKHVWSFPGKCKYVPYKSKCYLPIRVWKWKWKIRKFRPYLQLNSQINAHSLVSPKWPFICHVDKEQNIENW